MGSDKYSMAVDMWGAGCILGEILAGKPVFAGSSTLQQLELICGLLGLPDDETCASISQYAYTMITNLNVQEPTDSKEWERRFPGASRDALDLLQRLLQFDPRKRVSAADALKHDYLRQFHDEYVERVAPVSVSVCIPDEVRRSTNQYRERLYKEVTEFRRMEKEADSIYSRQNKEGGRAPAANARRSPQHQQPNTYSRNPGREATVAGQRVASHADDSSRQIAPRREAGMSREPMPVGAAS